MSEKWVILANI